MPMGQPFPIASEDQHPQMNAQLAELHARIKRQQEADKVPEYIPPPMHPVQAERTRLEQEEGKRQVAKATEERAKLQQPPPVVESTPQFRPADYVPDMNHGYVAGRTIKAG